MVLYVVKSYKTKFQIKCAIIANILKTSSENHVVLGRGRVVIVFQRSLSLFSLHEISLFYRTFVWIQRDYLRQYTNKFRYCYFSVTCYS